MAYDSETTTDQVLEGHDLSGKTVFVTGAASGLGEETVRALASKGAAVVMAGRDQAKLEDAKKRVLEKVPEAKLSFVLFDLGSLASIREGVAAYLEGEPALDVLINNAGVMACPEGKTADGFETQFGTNHLGHFLLTELLTPLLRKSAEMGRGPRVVIVSSLAHEHGKMHWDDLHFDKSYNSVTAYNQSKLANVLHARELAKRLSGTGINVYSLHPGVINTELARHLDSWYERATLAVARPFLKTPLQGAQTSIFCCVDESVAGDSGKYYSGCKEKRPAKAARNEADQQRLWELSERLVGLVKDEVK